MAFKEKASKTWSDLKRKLRDKKNQKKIEEEIKKKLRQGLEAIGRVEKKLKNPETRARMENKIREAREKLRKAKAEFNKKRAQTVAFTKDNPEKALAVAAAAGALAGALWVAFSKKK